LRLVTHQPPASEGPGGDHHPRCDEDDVLEHVLTLERRRVVRPGEQAPGQQHERREDAHELHGQQPDRDSHPAVGEQADADEALQRRDRDDPEPSGTSLKVSRSTVLIARS
jgi:hypothetical protein